MSRTYKDAPRKVRERRLGITEEKDNCPLCVDTDEQIAVFGFTAIFFAHEAREIQSFIDFAEEQGYSAHSEEARGYLGTSKLAEGEDLLRPNRPKSIFDGLFDRKRALYSQPRGIAKNLLWDRRGRPGNRQRTSRTTPFRRLSADEYFDQLLDRALHVSSKENLFVVVSISKEVAHSRRFHYHETSGALDYMLSDGHCHCSQCEPSEKTAKNRVRAAVVQLQKAFNSGDYEALEELSSSLSASSSR